MRRAGAIPLLGEAILGAPRRVLACAGVLLLLAAVLAGPVLGRLQPFSSDDPGSQSVAARRAIERASGLDPYYNLVALVRTPSGAESPAGRAAIAAVARVLAADPGVAAVRGGTGATVSRDGRAAYVEGVLHARPANAELDTARRVERRLRGMPGVTLGGVAAFYAQGNDSARHDLVLAELFAFPLLLAIALWVFRGLVAAVLPLAVGAFTIVCTLALLRVASELTAVSVYALNITTALGLGLAVDYSLLVVSRYREEIAPAGSWDAALRRTIASAGRTVAVSCATVAAVLSSLLVFPQPFLRSIGIGGILVALIAGASSLVFLPAVLALLRWRVNSLSPRRWRRAAHDGARPSTSSRWYRTSRLVMRRPLPIALASTAVLLALATPVLGLRITQVDWKVLPSSNSARAVHDAIAREFPSADGSPVIVAVRTPADGRRAQAGLARYAARLRALPGVAAVSAPAVISPTLAQVDVAPAVAPLSSAGQALVRRIRALPGAPPALVGGEGASLVDLKHSLGARLPLALAIIVIATLVAVFLMTRSVVLAVKALLMSTLTIAATLGVMVLVFQHGALEGLLGYTSSHALEPSTLVLVFALSFGLATDYGIFLLSRIAEQRRLGASDREAVADGLERTGPVVTAAALLLCVALGSLVTASHALVKEAGFGAALAVAIDATIVRVLLLPSLMCLLGRWNWWAPRLLARALPAPTMPPAAGAPPASATSAPVAGVAGAVAPREPSRARVPAVSPGELLAAGPAETLAATPFCDHHDRAIRAVVDDARDLAGGADELAVARALFEFVRDEVRYAFGPWGVPASTTLAQRAGTCTNKANLLVALLRAADVAGRLRRHACERARVFRRARPALPHTPRLRRVGPRLRRGAARRPLGEVRRLDRPRALGTHRALLPADPPRRMGRQRGLARLPRRAARVRRPRPVRGHRRAAAPPRAAEHSRAARDGQRLPRLRPRRARVRLLGGADRRLSGLAFGARPQPACAAPRAAAAARAELLSLGRA